MLRVCIFVVFFINLVSCSPMRQWQASNGAAINKEVLNAALTSCHYKESMRRSNELMMGSNHAPRSLEIAINKGDDDVTIERKQLAIEKINHSNEKINRSNSLAKQRSLILAKKANNCMKEKGYKRG